MTDLNDPGGARARNARHRARAEADRAERAARLGPEVVEYWTGVIRLAAPHVGAGRRPCDYTPWVAALREVLRVPPFVGTPTMSLTASHPNLMHVAEDIAQPGWPDPRPDLIEFALTFIEADVMLFRSGYTKRHLAKRLQQSPLGEVEVARIAKVLCRRVIEGAGLEEFRAYAKLAAYLHAAGRLPGFADWLDDTAQGAVLTLDRADGAEWQAMFWDNPNLSDLDKARLGRVHGLRPSKWGVVWPSMDCIVKAGKESRADANNKIRRNAYLMLRAIRRRQDGA